MVVGYHHFRKPPLRLNHRSNWVTNWHDIKTSTNSSFHGRTCFWWPPKWRHLCFQSLSMKFWGTGFWSGGFQMFVCSWNVLGRFNFFWGGWWITWEVFCPTFQVHQFFFPRYPQVIHHPKQQLSFEVFMRCDAQKISLTCSRRDWRFDIDTGLTKYYILKGWWMIPPIHVFIAGVWFGPY